MAKSNTALANDEEWEEYEIGVSDDTETDMLNNNEDEEDNGDDTGEHLESGDEGSGDEDIEGTDDGEDDAEDEDSQERSSDNRAESDASNKSKADLDSGSRSAKRIAELASALKRQEEKLARTVEEIGERDKVRAAEAELSVRKNGLTSTREKLEKEIQTLKSRYRVAREDGDSGTELQIVEDLQRKQLAILATETDLADVNEKQEALRVASRRTQTTTPSNEANPKAAAWLERNKWVAEAPEYIQKAVASQAEILISRGIDYNSDKFYDTLDQKVDRMLKDNELDYSVNYRVKPKQTGKENMAQKDTPKNKPKSNQPSREKNTGGSDEGLVLGKTKDGKVRVKVTAEDKEMARLLGIKPGTDRFEKYMKERVKTEKILTKQTKDTGPLWSTVFDS